MRRIQLLLCLLMLSSTVPAGDFAQLTFIGFSEDGNYLAFAQSGGGSESPLFDYDETYFIKTSKNTFAAEPVVLQFDDTIPAKSKPLLTARYKKNVAEKIKRFGIRRGNLGQLVVSHLLYDWSYITPVRRESSLNQNDGTKIKKMLTYYEGGYVPPAGGVAEKIIFNPSPSDFAVNTSEFYELTLTPTQIKGEINKGAYKIELTLKDNTQNQDTKIQILQKDTDNLPAARQHAFAYKIEQVYVYADKIAVFVNVFDPGFEGPDMRYMVVTGDLGKK